MMKLMIILLMVTASHVIDVHSQKTESDRTEKRELSKGNSAVDKRAPAISTVSPAITPGIEYADSKESQQDKSPTHQVYSTPLPPASKISDVLTGQGPAFQSAIASHLYAPVSVYQPRIGSPTTYEVSAPVPYNLAYAEHRVSLQPSQNALQFSQKSLQPSKNLQQALIQQSLAHPQTLAPIAQAAYQQIPQLQFQSIPLNQFQVSQYHGQQLQYQEAPVQIAQPIQPSIAYSPESRTETHQPSQRELKPQSGTKNVAKQATIQNYAQPQGAVSFAKFAQLQPTLALQAQQEIQYQPQHQPQLQQQLQYQPQLQVQQQLQYQPQQLQYQPQPPQYHLLQQPQIQHQPLQQYQILPQIEQSQQIQPLQYRLQPEQAQQQTQPQIQYVSQPQLTQKNHLPVLQQQYQPAAQQQINLQPISKAGNLGKISYLRPGPVFLQTQPDYRSNVALPTFPPVQYFGKYAQSIFENSQH